MSTRVRSLCGWNSAVSSTLYSLMKTWGLEIHFSLSRFTCTFPSLLYSLQGWPLGLHQQPPALWLLVWVWPRSSGGSSPSWIFHWTCVLSLWTDCSNVGCLKFTFKYSFLGGLRMPMTSAGWPLIDPLEIVDCLLDYMSDHTVAEFALGPAQHRLVGPGPFSMLMVH